MSIKTAFLSPKNFNIISGIIIIFLSVLLFIYSAAAVVFVLLILAIIIIFLGITHLMNIRSEIQNSKGGLKFKKSNIFVNYLIDALEVLIGIMLIIGLIYNPFGIAEISVRLVGSVIFLIGLSILYKGFKNYDYSKEFRSILMLIGVITIIFGLLIVFIPAIGFNIVTIVVALPLLFIGIIRTLKGILS